MKEKWKTKHCAICGCELNRKSKVYGEDNQDGRSHASEHHYVAKRFFGHSKTSKGKLPRKPIFNSKNCPPQWEDKKVGILCYDCHEELLHNPVFLASDIKQFAKLVELMNLNENDKPKSKDKIKGRIVLLHEVIEKGIKAILRAEKRG